MTSRATKRRVVAITVLASLLIALLAFNVTYAYFTDKLSGSAEVSFGTVSLKSTTAISTTNVSGVFPGGKFRINGVISISDSTDEALWVYFGIDKSQISMKIGSNAVAKDVQNPNYHDGTSGGHRYTDEDVAHMKNIVESAIVAGLVQAVNTNLGNGNNQNSTAWRLDTEEETMGITSVAVPVNTPDFDFSKAGEFTFGGNDFGNLFQGVSISFTIEIKAIQSSHLSKAQAATAFKSDNFLSGENLL